MSFTSWQTGHLLYVSKFHVRLPLVSHSIDYQNARKSKPFWKQSLRMNLAVCHKLNSIYNVDTAQGTEDAEVLSKPRAVFVLWNFLSSLCQLSYCLIVVGHVTPKVFFKSNWILFNYSFSNTTCFWGFAVLIPPLHGCRSSTSGWVSKTCLLPFAPVTGAALPSTFWLTTDFKLSARGRGCEVLLYSLVSGCTFS